MRIRNISMGMGGTGTVLDINVNIDNKNCFSLNLNLNDKELYDYMDKCVTAKISTKVFDKNKFKLLYNKIQRVDRPFKMRSTSSVKTRESERLRYRIGVLSVDFQTDSNIELNRKEFYR